ncbi:MAG: hypothetical protein CMP61_05395 [Flavobacteriales bacterium]|nr:hypothetical protein [Flavobacteriales bacterium]|tara:strand:+ start:39445 stop:40689 length:1245 start_codon:yes stop_codon:yes gene_type:complete
MDFGQFLKPVIYALLALVGLVVIITPSVSYEEAYFVGDDYYITMVDSIEVGYEPYLKGLIQAEQNVLASKEKKAFHKKLKPLADSLSLLQSKAELSKDSTRIANAKNAYFDFQEMKSKQEQLIDEKYAITKLNDAVLINKIDGLKKSLSMDDYIVIVANQIRNPNGLSTIPSVTPNDLNIQKVNLQDPGGYYIVGLILIGITLFMYFMDKGSIPIESNGFRVGGTIAMIVLAIILGFKSYFSLANDIKFKEISELRETEVREKLMLIKDLQVQYLSDNKKYCSSWDSLLHYAKNDSAQIIRYLVDKNDTAAVNNALRAGKPIKDTAYVPINIKVYGEKQSINLDSLPYVPYTQEKFSLKTAKTKNANNRDVFYIEVKTKKKTYLDMLKIYPKNFDEDVVIQFGSLTEPTTEGNW